MNDATSRTGTTFGTVGALEQDRMLPTWNRSRPRLEPCFDREHRLHTCAGAWQTLREQARNWETRA